MIRRSWTPRASAPQDRIRTRTDSPFHWTALRPRRLFATLNPTLADGHLLVGIFAALARRHTGSSRRRWPRCFRSRFRSAPECEIRIAPRSCAPASHRSRTGALGGHQLGVRQQVCQKMLARCAGRHAQHPRRPAFAPHLASSTGNRSALRRRSTWTSLSQGTQSLTASAELPRACCADEASFERQFWLETHCSMNAVRGEAATSAWPASSRCWIPRVASLLSGHPRSVGTFHLIIDRVSAARGHTSRRFTA